MRIQVLDRKTGIIKVVPEILDDLWHLEQVIEPGDSVSGSSDRKIKGKDEQQKSEQALHCGWCAAVICKGSIVCT